MLAVMAVLTASCPGCGAPLEFSIGQSAAKICDFCRTTVARTDHGLENLGKVAALAATPSLIAVGDSGTLGGRPIEVLGRVQLDHGEGPWDEYYVGFDYGAAWGWLAFAEGRWYVTSEAPGVAPPPLEALSLEQDVPLAGAAYRVAEIKQGTIVSSEGELPAAFPDGFVRRYADLFAPGGGFATLDYGDGRARPQVFTGFAFEEQQLVVQQLGERSANKVKVDQLQCPSCGGGLPKLTGERAERLGCPFCGAVSDVALQQVVYQQEKLRQDPQIPLGSRGVIDDVEWITVAYMRRSTSFDGELFSWEEYLLWSPAAGFRWLVKDEGKWSWVVSQNLAELDLSRMPASVGRGGKTFRKRNANDARVEYVLGEVYWKCRVGETTAVMDFTSGDDVLSREASESEVRWSYSTPISWLVIARAFALALAGRGEKLPPPPRSGARIAALLGALTVGSLMSCGLMTCGGCNPTRSYVASTYATGVYSYPQRYYAPSTSGGSGSSGSGSSYRGGSSSYSGGK